VETDAPHLRPLGIGEVLDVALKIVWRNAGTLFRIVFFIVLPVQVISVVLQLSAVTASDSSGFDSTSSTFDGTDAAAVIGAVVLGVILGWIGSTVASGACFRAIASAYLGERTGWKDSVVFVARRLHSLLWVTILGGLVTILGFVACIIPGIWLWVAFALAVPVLLMEDRRGWKALSRSRALVKGFWWRAFAIMVLGIILGWIISTAIGGLIGGAAAFGTSSDEDVAGAVAQVIAGTIAKLITTPFIAAFVTVLYFDLRVRKEAFDLQLLAERIGVEPPAGALGPRRDDRPQIPHGEEPPFWPPPPGWKPGGADGS
jgi:hypothetical protein